MLRSFDSLAQALTRPGVRQHLQKRARSRPRLRPLRLEVLDQRVMLEGSPIHHIVTFNTNVGSFDVELFDDVAPLTVANFLGYVNRGDYNNSIVHRAVQNFVVQGGGFKYPGGSLPPLPSHIPTVAPVQNEHSLSNVRGTIAMARVGGQVNSATSEWFFNVKDNGGPKVGNVETLDTVDQGFTVFGRVLGDGMSKVDAIANLQLVNAGGAFGTVPVQNFTPGQSSLNANNLVLINSVTIAQPISGTAYGDLNGNGQRDPNEIGFAGATIYLDTNDNGVLNPGERSTVTDVNGNYTFTNVPFGSYVIRMVPSNTITQTAPSGDAPSFGARRPTIASNVPVTGQDFGATLIVAAPARPVLPANFDTGSSNSDGITRLGTLQFQVGGVTPSATVTLYKVDGQNVETAIGSAVASGTTVTINVNNLPEGAYPKIIARQTWGGFVSPASENRSLIIDSTLPQFSSSPAPESLDVNAGALFTYTPQLSEDAVLSLSVFPAGMALDPVTKKISFTPTVQQVGNQTVTIQATDLAGNVGTQSFTLKVHGPPLFAPIADTRLAQGEHYSFATSVTSVDPVTFRLADGSPSWASINAVTGQITWSPLTSTPAGTYGVTVIVSNTFQQSATQVASVTVLAPPTIAPIPNQVIVEGEKLEVTITITDTEEPLTTLVGTVPAGAAVTNRPDTGGYGGVVVVHPFSSRTDTVSAQPRTAQDQGETTFTPAIIHEWQRKFFWTPSESQGPGVYTITVQAVTFHDLPSTQTFQVTVQEKNEAPTLDAVTDKTVNRGSTLSFKAVGRDVDLPAQTLTYSLADGAPTGATIDQSTGNFTWTPSASVAAGSYAVTINVKDSSQQTASRTFNITVNTPPVLTAIADQSINELAPLTIPLQATDVGPIQFAFVGAAPAGASLNSTTGQLKWTPSEAQGPGVYTVTVKATDGGGLSATQTFKITVKEVNAAPTLDAVPTITANRGTTVSFKAAAHDPDLPAQALTFGLAAGAPTGAAIHPQTGLFTWDIPVEFPEGPVTMTINVTDAATGGLTASQSFTVVVTSSNIGFALFGSWPDQGVLTSSPSLLPPAGPASPAALAALALSAVSGGGGFDGSAGGQLESGIVDLVLGLDTGLPQSELQLLAEARAGGGDGSTPGEGGESGDGQIQKAGNVEPLDRQGSTDANTPQQPRRAASRTSGQPPLNQSGQLEFYAPRPAWGPARPQRRVPVQRVSLPAIPADLPVAQTANEAATDATADASDGGQTARGRLASGAIAMPLLVSQLPIGRSSARRGTARRAKLGHWLREHSPT